MNTVDACYIDDAPAAGGTHTPGRSLSDDEYGREIDVDDASKVCGIVINERTRRQHAGIVDQHVDGTQIGNRGSHLVSFAHVSAKAYAVLQRGCKRVGRFAVDVHDADAIAGIVCGACNRGANTAAAAGHK